MLSTSISSVVESCSTVLYHLFPQNVANSFNYSIKCSKISTIKVKKIKIKNKNDLDERLNLYMNLTNESQISIHHLISQN